MVTGSTHASLRAMPPDQSMLSVTDNYAQNSMPTITFTKIPGVNWKFPEFYRINRFPEFFRFFRVVRTTNRATLKLPCPYTVPWDPQTRQSKLFVHIASTAFLLVPWNRNFSFTGSPVPVSRCIWWRFLSHTAFQQLAP